VKKKLALLLAALLLTGTLAGCTSAELGYLELARRANGVSEGEISGTAQVEIDMTALTGLFSGEEDLAAVPPDGGWKKKLSVSWQGSYSTVNGLWEELSIQCGADGKEWDLGTVFFDGISGEVTISRQTLLGAMELMQALDPDLSQCYAYTEEYRRDLSLALGDAGYLSVSLYEDEHTGALMRQFMKGMAGSDGAQARILDAALTFLRDAHAGYETGLVKKISGSYQMKITLAQIPRLLRGYLTYIEANPEEYREALNVYLRACADESGALLGGMLADEEESGGSGAALGTDLFSDAVQIGEEDMSAVTGWFDTARSFIDQAEKSEPFRALKDSYYAVELSQPSAGVFEYKVRMGLTADGADLAAVTAEVRTRETAASFAAPQAAMTEEQLDDTLLELAKKYNSVSTVSLHWYDPDGSDDMSSDWDLGLRRRALSYSETELREPLWAQLGGDGRVEFEMRGGRLFVKLEDICSALGLSPQWNSNVQRAYVPWEGTFVYLDGYQKDQRTWIAVRELEKLGYVVFYEGDEWGGNTVTIHRI